MGEIVMNQSWVSRCLLFQCRENLNCFSCLLFSQAQFVQTLEIEPELRTGTKEVAQA